MSQNWHANYDYLKVAHEKKKENKRNFRNLHQKLDEIESAGFLKKFVYYVWSKGSK